MFIFELRALNLVGYVVQMNERKYDLSERANKQTKERRKKNITPHIDIGIGMARDTCNRDIVSQQ